VPQKVITLDDAVDAYLLHRGTGRGAGIQKVVRIPQELVRSIAEEGERPRVFVALSFAGAGGGVR